MCQLKARGIAGAALFREFGSTLKKHQELANLPDPGSIEAVKVSAFRTLFHSAPHAKVPPIFTAV